MPDRLEDLVRELVGSVVDSFEKLEVIVLLSKRSEAMTFDEIHAALGEVHQSSLEEAVASLVEQTILVVTDGRYAIHADSTWSKHLAALTTLYGTNRMRVATMMSDAAMRRVRQQAERVFADAFLIGLQKNNRGSSK